MRKVFPFLVCVILTGIIAFQTIAYITAQTKTTNVVTTGTLDMELSSLTVDKDGNIAKFESEIRNVIPGSIVSQMPYVTNTGTEDFYTRVHLDSIITKNGEELPNPLVFNIDETKWKLDSDGWYRYVNIIKVGETAPDPLYTEVYFPVEMGNEYVGSVTNITLKAQSVQSEYNENQNVLDVQGWPEIGGN